MYEYTPWSKSVLSEITAIPSQPLPILDIQLGGACNLKCVYCDTPRYGCPCSIDVEAVSRIINSGYIKWIYVCGLGEPTAPGNVNCFKEILKVSKRHGVKVSAFSNVLNLDDEVLNYIDNGTLYVLFKLDSFDKDTIKTLYNTDKSDILLRNYEKLTSVVHIENGTTNLAASIVPTTKNYSKLCFIIDYCEKKLIFPLLGQLENAGKGSDTFDKLKLEYIELMKIRNYMKVKYGFEYEIPRCPATFSSMHITNTNKVIVDEKTGLSCAWFWMEDPKMIELGDIRAQSAQEITSRIIAYRKSKLNDVISIERTLQTNPFGGCGGDAKKLLQEYIKMANFD